MIWWENQLDKSFLRRDLKSFMILSTWLDFRNVSWESLPDEYGNKKPFLFISETCSTLIAFKGHILYSSPIPENHVQLNCMYKIYILCAIRHIHKHKGNHHIKSLGSSTYWIVTVNEHIFSIYEFLCMPFVSCWS